MVSARLFLYKGGKESVVGPKDLTIEHDGRSFSDFAHVARFLFELPDSGLFCRLPFIDEAGGDLDHNLVYGWPVLLLQDNFGPYVVDVGHVLVLVLLAMASPSNQGA